ncbi:MAG: hypothetical protein A2Y25_04395 [Candidatus Melainabacteria bacterium GWF2_37_15]|nr:MAG: hypothetical protein A2Y25_04395 [Candidatus Melainabacteria bacterium GWF2_37_15]
MSRKTTVILHNRVSENATPDDADVLDQVKLVKCALENLNYDVVTLEFDLDLKNTSMELKNIKPEFVFNLVESVENNGQLIHLATSLLEHLKIPYTGCPNEAVFITSNKLLAKKILKGEGIKTPEDENTRPFIKGKYIVKSVWEHASIGLDEKKVIYAESPEQITVPNGFFAERYIEGREFNISILAGKVLPLAEIIFSNYSADRLKIVDYKAKWDKNSFEYNNTPRSFDFDEKDEKLLERLGKITRKCWEIFNLKGYARVDFRVDENNEPYVLEINSNPCISEDSGFYAAAVEAGLEFEEVVRLIIKDLRVQPSGICS